MEPLILTLLYIFFVWLSIEVSRLLLKAQWYWLWVGILGYLVGIAVFILVSELMNEWLSVSLNRVLKPSLNSSVSEIPPNKGSFLYFVDTNVLMLKYGLLCYITAFWFIGSTLYKRWSV